MISTLLQERILVLDGAMGTVIHSLGFSETDFRGQRFALHPLDLRGNNDVLTLTQPAAVCGVYEQYLLAGADIISTNTFNSNRISQADYKLSYAVSEMNREAAAMAKTLTIKYSTPAKPRFVAGSMGPTGKSASMSPDVNDPARRSVTFDDLAAAYAEQAAALIDGGADILLCETVFDTLNLKAALFAISQLFMQRGHRWPVMVSATITDASGRILSGQTIEAFLHSVSHFPLMSIGINCAFGAQQMLPFVERLARIAPFPVSVHPNAGLPNKLGSYDQKPDEMAAYIRTFLERGLVNIVGGCCGTTPAHIERIVQVAANAMPRRIPQPADTLLLSGLEPLDVTSTSGLIRIGERCNVAGSRKFARLIREEKFDEAISIARMQAEVGAHVVDVNMDDAMLDAEKSMVQFLHLMASEPDVARLPVMLDSSRWEVIEAGLKCVQGKAIVNSISLKEGEDAFREKARLIRQYGAAVTVMAFDESGQATDFDRRITICSRAYRILTEEVGFPPTDIIFDPNVLTIGTGIEEHNNFAVDFIRAVRWIKEHLPGAHVSGGVSNLSFAFRGNNYLREAMHAVFLHHAANEGLDMGIVNVGAMPLYSDIPKNLTEALEDLIFNRKADATERLLEMAASLKNMDAPTVSQQNNLKWREQSLKERMNHAFICGVTEYIEVDMEEALRIYPSALRIIEELLMAAMNEVGNKFAAGNMFLPQVIKSARVMRRAVAYLQPFIEAEKAAAGKVASAGKILLATVKGDVHDIGKNIVSVVLACNNYEIIDLGVMVPCEKIIAVAKEQEVDIVGLSGLITPSLDEMIRVAKEMERHGMVQPIIIGGATTSMEHTAIKIQPAYSQPVVQVKDASRSVSAASALLARDAAFIKELRGEYHKINAQQKATVQNFTLAEARANRLKIDWVAEPPITPAMPGIYRWIEYPLYEIRKYINWTPFFFLWKLKGNYPTVFEHPKYGSEARKLYDDANRMLDSIVAQKSLTANAVFGIFPANSNGDDDIEIYTDERRTETICTFFNQRNQTIPEDQKPNLCVADFIAPRATGVNDWIGAFAATAGIGANKLAEQYKAAGDEYSAIMVKALADRLAEALAKLIHTEISHKYWGFSKQEFVPTDAQPNRRYGGTRLSHGYPALQDHSEKATLFGLLNAHELGMGLTETFAMTPAATVSGLIFAHPQSKPFIVWSVTDEQKADYDARKQQKTSSEGKNDH